MGYNIYFAGLVCFSPFVDGLDVLLPDARSGDYPHIAAVVLDPKRVHDADWWHDEETDSLIAEGIYPVRDSTELTFTGATDHGHLERDHWNRLPNLRKLNPKFRLKQHPDTIVTSRLTNGVFEAWKHPNEGGEAFITSLSVPYDGLIRIEAGDHYLRVFAGTTVALANVEKPYLDAEAAFVDENDYDHFQYYSKLAPPSADPLTPPKVNKLSKLGDKDHPVFKGRRMLKIGCSNTGCC